MKKNAKWAERFVSAVLMLGMFMGLATPLGVVSASPVSSADQISAEQPAPAVAADVSPSGDVWAWGVNSIGQLGTTGLDTCDAYSCSKTAIIVPGMIDVVQVAAGAGHSIALKADGTVWGWGLNDLGQLGAETGELCSGVPCSTTPVQIAGLENVIAISAGDFYNLALISGGTVVGWGQNSTSQLTGTSALSCISSIWGAPTAMMCSRTPVPVVGLNTVTAISAGFAHSMALKADGTVWTWGWNDFGTLGAASSELCGEDANDMCSTTPVQVNGLTGEAIAIDAGGENSLVLMSDNTVMNWGLNNRGQLGATSSDTCIWSDTSATYDCSKTPLPVTDLTDVVQIATSKHGLDDSGGFSMALKSDGTLWGWGPNGYGQLGDGTLIDKNVPVQATGMTDIVQFSAGFWHAIAVKSDGSVYGWGRNLYGEVGDGTNFQRSFPSFLGVINGLVALSAGQHHTLAVLQEAPASTYTISGTIYDNHIPALPLEGATISFDGTTPPTTATSAVNGIYTLNSIPEGATGNLSVSKMGYAFGDPIAIAAVTVNLTGQNFTATNSAPVAENDSYNVVEETAMTVDAPGVLGNDPDTDTADTKTAALVEAPSNALAFTLNADGSFNYTPNADFFGADTFTYKANDGTFDSNTATVTLNVANVNDAPVAVDDAYATDEDTDLTVPAVDGVLKNDTDVDADTLTAAATGDPSHGTLILNGDGSFTYSPEENWSGTDTFTYTANDGTIDSNEATVAIEVGSSNDAPVAVNDSYAAEVDNIIDVDASMGVLKNDTDAEGDPLTATKLSNPLNGELAFNPDGSFSFNPDGGFNGIDSFTYKVNDGTLDSNVATVYMKMDKAPVVVDDVFSVDEDGNLVTVDSVLINDTDDDLDPLTAIKVSNPDHGVLVWNTDGTFTYTPEANWNGTDTFTYKANDALLDSKTDATVTITVKPLNDVPVAVDDAQTIAWGHELVVAAPGVLANDTDVDGDALTAALVEDVSHGTLILNADGSYTYTSDDNFSGDDTFKYKANDGEADLNEATVTIHVIDVNRAPVAVDDSYSTMVDTELVVSSPSLLANDTDEDLDPLTAVVATDPDNGTVSINPDGSFTYMPNLDFEGIDTFTYTANDGTVNSAPATVSVTVLRDPNAPFAADNTFQTREDRRITVKSRVILRNDTDPAGLKVKAILMNRPAHGKLYFRPNGYFIYTPERNWNGTDTFTYRATNGTYVSNIATVSIVVDPRNDRPVARGDKFITEMNMALTVPAPGLLNNDFDVDNDALTIEIVRKPGRGTLVVEPDGSFVYTPKVNFLGTEYFRYRLFDGILYSPIVTVRIVMVRPTYSFSGFFAPVQNMPVVNLATAGNSISFQFSLDGDRGPIVVPNAGPSSERVTCPKTVPVEISEYSTEPAGMTYNAVSDQYTYVWETNPNWLGTCRKFKMKLNDGTVHVAMFKFQ